MAYDSSSLDDYVDVPSRIAEFRGKYPHGSLRPVDPQQPWQIVQVPAEWCVRCIGRQVAKNGEGKNAKWGKCPRCGGSGVRDRETEPLQDTFIVYAAAAYREPDDPRPGIGVAWEPYPGRTPYTAASELMNAETSAWGRAIIAALAADAKAGIASREEVRNRREDGLPVNRDGSLSRSRTTDEQKEAAGVMTSAQLKEHTALRPKPVEDRAGKRRAAQAGDGQWMTPGPAMVPGEIPGQPGDGHETAGPGRGAPAPTSSGSPPPAAGAALPAAGGPPLKAEPGSATGPQIVRLHAMLTGLDWNTRSDADRGAVLAIAERIIGRELAGPHTARDGSQRTTTNLSAHEARMVMDLLQADPDQYRKAVAAPQQQPSAPSTEGTPDET